MACRVARWAPAPAVGVLLARAGVDAIGLTDTGAVNSFWGNWGYGCHGGRRRAGGLRRRRRHPVGGRAGARGRAGAKCSARFEDRTAARGLGRRRPIWGTRTDGRRPRRDAHRRASRSRRSIAVAIPSTSDPLRIVALLAVVAFGPVVFQIGFLFAGHWVLVFVAPAGAAGSGAAAREPGSAANPSRIVPAFAAIAGLRLHRVVRPLRDGAHCQREHARLLLRRGNWRASRCRCGSPATATTRRSSSARATEDLIAATEPRATAQVRSPATAEFDIETGLPIDPDAPVFAVAGHATAECPGCGGPTAQFFGQLSVVAEGDLEMLLDHDISDADLAAFRDGAAITTEPGLASADGEVVVTEWTETGRAEYDTALMGLRWDDLDGIASLPSPLAVHELDSRFIDLGHAHRLQVIVSPEAAAELGVKTVPSLLIATYDSPLSTEVVDKLAADGENTRVGDEATLWVYEELGPDSVAPWLWLILGVAVVLVVGASAVCLGLARFERRPDDATLSAVGGGPMLRRNVNAWQAVTIVGIGSVVGTAVALVPVWGMTQSTAGYMDMADTPWLWLGILGIGLPLAITAVAWLVHSGIPISPAGMRSRETNPSRPDTYEVNRPRNHHDPCRARHRSRGDQPAADRAHRPHGADRPEPSALSRARHSVASQAARTTLNCDFLRRPRRG